MKKQTKTLIWISLISISIIIIGFIIYYVFSLQSFFPNYTVYYDANWIDKHTLELTRPYLYCNENGCIIYNQHRAGNENPSTTDIAYFYNTDRLNINIINLYWGRLLKGNFKVAQMQIGATQVCDEGLTDEDRNNLKNLGLIFKDYTNDIGSRQYYSACNYKAWFSTFAGIFPNQGYKNINIADNSYCIVEGTKSSGENFKFIGKVIVEWDTFSCNIDIPSSFYASSTTAKTTFYFWQTPPLQKYYRFENNQCKLIEIPEQDRQNNDYLIESDCKSNIKTGETCQSNADCKSCFSVCQAGKCQNIIVSSSPPCENATWQDYPSCSWDKTTCLKEKSSNYVLIIIAILIILIFAVIFSYFIIKKKKY